jgi:hypothetical protein
VFEFFSGLFVWRSSRGSDPAAVLRPVQINLERKIGQQEEAEGAEEGRLAKIGGVTCQVGMEGLHDSIPWIFSLLSPLPPVQRHFGF